MVRLLGIDIGTSGTKTVLFDEGGNELFSHLFEYEMMQPKNGWAEQDPDDWWHATISGIKTVLEKSGKTEISGIGLSGQMHGLVMLDENGKVLRPSIIWCDQRTKEEAEDIKNILGEKKVIEITANPVMTSFTAAKILWVKKNEPEIYKKCKHILLPKDYIRYKLTGDFATEVSDASGMQLMNVSERGWSDEMLKALGIDKNLLGKMHESQDVTGKTSYEIEKLTGLAEGTIVVGGAGDNPAAAIGTGVYKEGDAFLTVGTSAVLYAVSDKLKIDLKGRVHSLCASVPGKWTIMSCTQAAGLSLRWLRDNICTEEVLTAKKRGVDPYEIICDEANKINIGSDNLIYLPYLMGERSPHPDPNARGVFFGLSGFHKRANLIRSVMEGVAFSQLECINVFRKMGVPAFDITITGGGGRSLLWRQMFADLFRCPFSIITNDQGGALGAAILAGVGTGVYTDIENACKKIVHRKDKILPNLENSIKYEKFFNLYTKLYLDLKEDFQLLK
ncbi:MAG: xylulokinase [Clostridiales Family XIII bacterium]|jgi:xylulokinase|nr:xylulokinase [Clostridiales Family XIII bacterium]